MFSVNSSWWLCYIEVITQRGNARSLVSVPEWFRCPNWKATTASTPVLPESVLLCEGSALSRLASQTSVSCDPSVAFVIMWILTLYVLDGA